jgi:chromosome segregation ATPase
MSDATNELKAALRKDLDALRSLRDELCVQATLAKAEARTEWTRLEGRFQLLQEELGRVQNHSKSTLQEIESKISVLAEELKRGYDSIRRAFQQ